MKILYINGKQFQIVKSAKVLGVTVTDDLKWNKNVSKIVESLKQRHFIY